MKQCPASARTAKNENQTCACTNIHTDSEILSTAAINASQISSILTTKLTDSVNIMQNDADLKLYNDAVKTIDSESILRRLRTRLKIRTEKPLETFFDSIK